MMFVTCQYCASSEIDATSSVHHSGTPLECVSTVSKQSAGRKQVFNVHSDVVGAWFGESLTLCSY